VIVLAWLSRSLTSPPIWSAAAANRSLLACQAWALSTASDATMTWSRPGTVTGHHVELGGAQGVVDGRGDQRVGVEREHLRRSAATYSPR